MKTVKSYKENMIDELLNYFYIYVEIFKDGTSNFEKRYRLKKELKVNIPKNSVIMYSVHSRIDEGYVGTIKGAYRLFQRGLTEIQKADKKHKVCSIGWDAKNEKWWGWSHRAMRGFGLGDEVIKGSCCALSGFTEEYLEKHPEEDKSLPIGFKAKNFDDCKKMAIAFTEAVS